MLQPAHHCQWFISRAFARIDNEVLKRKNQDNALDLQGKLKKYAAEKSVMPVQRGSACKVCASKTAGPEEIADEGNERVCDGRVGHSVRESQVGEDEAGMKKR